MKIGLTVGILLLGVVLLQGLFYVLSPEWPFAVLFSDIYSTVFQKETWSPYVPQRSVPLRAGRIFISGGIAVVLVLLGWASSRKKESRWVALGVLLGVVGLGLPIYPYLRALITAHVFGRDPNAFSFETFEPQSGAPVRLVMSTGSSANDVLVPYPLSPGSTPKECFVHVTRQQLLEVVDRSRFFQFPSTLELEETLGHDWMRVTLSSNKRWVVTTGLRAGGRHSSRLRELESIILAGMSLDVDPWWQCSQVR